MVSRALLLVALLPLAAMKPQTNPCTAQLLSTVELLSKQCDPDQHSNYHVSYSLDTEGWDDAHDVHRFEVYSNGGRHYLLSSDYSVMADETLTVSIQKPTKVLSIGNSLTPQMREQSIARVMQQQVANINMLELQSCERIAVDGQERTQLVMRCPDGYREAYRIDRVSYVFDENFLYEASVYGLEGNPMKVTTYRVHRIETDQAFDPLEKSPTDFIFDTEGHLLPEFTDYAIEQIGNVPASTTLPSTQQPNQ